MPCDTERLCYDWPTVNAVNAGQGDYVDSNGMLAWPGNTYLFDKNTVL